MLKQLSSAQHPLVKHLVKVRQNRDYRYDHQSVVIEGQKIIEELAKHNKFKCVLVTHEDLFPKNLHAEETLLVTPEIIQKISGMVSPEGIIVEMEMPKSSSLKGLSRILVLDGISDPGNMGTLLRSALALGWEGVFITEHSCDPFNEKTLRAARGATFRLPIAWGTWEELKQLMAAGNLEGLVADLAGETLDTIELKRGVALVLGNEARGCSPEAKRLCRPVTIPMPGEMESLNVSVAGSIMMYVLGAPGRGR